MRLAIISHTPHYRQGNHLVGWGATVREIDQLATLFDTVVHVAPLYAGAAPGSSLPYRSPRVRLSLVPPAGGETLGEKVSILCYWPVYLRAILREYRDADVIHVRAPANISLLAMVWLAFLPGPKKRWLKYAGNWGGGTGEPWSYRFQRWWLRNPWHRGRVTVNGQWLDQPAHIRSFLNPCLTEAELQTGQKAAAAKDLRQPVRCVFVGRVERAKGVGICLETMAALKARGIASELDIIGDGPERPDFERQARQLAGHARAIFHGSLPRPELERYYARAHFVLLPSACSEGWPKVLSEAMACGAVPIASSVGCVPSYLQRFGSGRSIPTLEARAFAEAIASYLASPSVWQDESRRALAAADGFSYANYLGQVRSLLECPGSEAVVAE